MKAMLIMDMPSSCRNCPCIDTSYEFHGCKVTGKTLELEDRYEKRPIHCPLREVPQKPDYPPINENSYVAGYNACIDEILGGGE